MRCLMLAALLFAAAPVAAQEASRPAARIDDLAWLAGEWRGEGIGGHEAIESYSGPAGGEITGHFVQTDGKGAVQFYKLLSIVRDGDSLAYRLGHFDPDLSAWEEKGEHERFPLTARTGDRWTFDGLILERTGVDAMTASVAIKRKDGSAGTLAFRYRRVR